MGICAAHRYWARQDWIGLDWIGLLVHCHSDQWEWRRVPEDAINLGATLKVVIDRN
jgi:hypothetical protein